MRTELELIEKIERYLNGQLTASEKTEFEAQLNADPKLKEEVSLQQELMKGIERASLKQKLQHTGKRYRRIRNITRGGFTGFIILMIAAAVFYFHKKDGVHLSYKDKELPEYNEAGEKNWSTADRNLEAQLFFLDAGSDTVIETRGGMVLSVPANGFLDKNGEPVKGKFELVVKEALDAASIMRAGLSTRSGDSLLETGGMFFLDARKDGEILKINPSNALSADVPTDSVKPGMQLFSGKRMPDSSIDWVNPRPLEHMLVPVDIQSLNFYPPHYLDSLKSWGQNAGNKTFTDSLYYSLAFLFDAAPRMERDYSSEADTPRSENMYLDTHSSVNTEYRSNGDSILCGINPAKIKTIWNKHFQNTLISTREFGERISWIHRSGKNSVLDLYVNNLDKNLSYIDSLAAGQLNGKSTASLHNQFLSFASRQDGKIKNGNKQFDKLREYYQRKAIAFTEAIAKTQRDYRNKQAELDDQAAGKQAVHQMDSMSRINKIFEEEFSLNLRDAWKQLGYDTTINTGSWGRTVYSVQLINTGWCNVDRYVEESVLSRVSLNYTDPQTGKKAVIRYLPVSFQVNGSEKFDRLSVYLLPDKLSSFMRVAGANGKYAEKLDELLKYKLVCVGFQGDQAFLYSQTDIVSKDYPAIVLNPVGKNDLDRELNKLGNSGQSAAVHKESLFFQFEIRDQKRKKHNQDLNELRERLINLIFPCTLDALPENPRDYELKNDK